MSKAFSKMCVCFLVYSLYVWCKIVTLSWICQYENERNTPLNVSIS